VSKEKLVHDPANYRRMSEPFANIDEAQTAWTAFVDELVELRKKHRIKEVFVVGEISMIRNDEAGEPFESAATMAFHLGAQSETIRLAAFGYGVETERHKQEIERVVAAARKRAK
jgi:hypothetical protein